MRIEGSGRGAMIVRLQPTAQRLARVLRIVAAWALFGLFNGTQTGVTRLYLGTALPWRQFYWYSAFDALVWICFTPAMFALARALSPVRRGWALAALGHFAAGIAMGTLHLYLTVLLVPMVGYRAAPGRTLFGSLITVRLQFDLLTYWLVIGILTAVDYYRRFRERELHASQLETSLAEARLSMLRAQLQPHFLFNTMNTISSLMYKDVAGADRVLQRLAGFLRLTLETASAKEVRLETEMEYTSRYLDIEETRFSDRLAVERQIAPGVLDAMVPTLILQPFVENAIRHGVGARAEGGRIWIRAERAGALLRVEVEDDGEAPQEVREGVGLGNARSRLAAMYGERARLEAGAGAAGGFRVTMELPFRTGGQS
jgi:two-component system, LytTR family, sensor kinase